MKYSRVHLLARQCMEPACVLCGSRENLEAALYPTPPQEDLIFDEAKEAWYCEDISKYHALCPSCHRNEDQQWHTSCRRGHPRTKENTLTLASGHRRCRVCDNESYRKRYQTNTKFRTEKIEAERKRRGDSNRASGVE